MTMSVTEVKAPVLHFKAHYYSTVNSVMNDDTYDVDYDIDDDADSIISKRRDSVLSNSFIDLSKLLLASDFDFGLGLGSQVKDSTKKKFTSMKLRTQEKLRRLRDDTYDQQDIQKRISQRLSKFDAKINANLQSSNTEKLFYAFAVFLIAVSGFIIGKYPSYFHVFYTGLFALLMPIRFYTYFKQSYQFYLADLCYYVNLLLILFIWFFPYSRSLFISLFSLTMGTLSFAVITWRNSLVLHLIEKTTSSFIHIMPPVTMFVIVHELPHDYKVARFPAVASITDWSFFNGIIWTSIYYTIWQVCYHYFITIKKSHEINSGKVTSFTYLKEKNSQSFLGKLVNSLPYTWMQIGAFTLIQFGYQLLTMIFCPIWFKYKHACGTFMCFIFVWASYNGATYYIDVFGKKFEKEVAKLKAEINELQKRDDEVLVDADLAEHKRR